MQGSNQINNLQRGIFLILIANAINLCISLVNGFVLPKYLSVESYAAIKTFQLYVNYIGILHFGYSDGLYLHYGGKKISDIESKDVNICRTNLVVTQGIITILGVLVSFALGNTMLLIASLCVLPLNIVTTYKSIFQATGEFDVYSKLLNYSSILTLFGTVFFIFGLKVDDSRYYVGWTAVVSVIIWLLIERKMRKQYNYSIKLQFELVNLVTNINSGIVLLLGNFSSILMTSIDRWFVKALLSVTDFAYYSFVISVENLIAIFITPIVTTMYNYICSTVDLESLKKIKQMCLVFGVFLISAAFPVKFILETYLTKYIATRKILFILFSTEVFYILIKGIYVNIYKARKQQGLYLKQLLIVIAIGTLLNAIAYLINHSNEAIALATLVSVIIWYVICCVSVKELRPTVKENLILVVIVPVFILLGCFLPSILGFCIYIFVAFVLTFMLAREGLYSMALMLKNTVMRKLKKNGNL